MAVPLPVTRCPIGTLRPVTSHTFICDLFTAIISIPRVAEVLKMERVLPVRVINILSEKKKKKQSEVTALYWL